MQEAGCWWQVGHNDPRAAALADRHYSRQTPGSVQFTAPGRKLVLLSDDERALWAAVENLDPAGRRKWRVAIFRNEGQSLSSDLVREATARTLGFWTRFYGGCPAVPLRTEVDVRKVRAKRDPGRCFLRAGWRRVPDEEVARAAGRGMAVLEAPGELERLRP